MAAISQTATEELLADAGALLGRLCPGLMVRIVVLSGPPNEELVRASEGAEAVFVGRGAPGSRSRTTVSGTVSGWKQNHHGERDGLYLDDGIEVHFPPHRAAEVGKTIREGMTAEVTGTWQDQHFHANSITDSNSGTSVEAHRLPGEGPGKSPLGHTARFVVDHVTCDVVVLRL